MTVESESELSVAEDCVVIELTEGDIRPHGREVEGAGVAGCAGIRQDDDFDGRSDRSWPFFLKVVQCVQM